RHTEYTIQFDPEGSQYMEFLFPNAIQLKQVENGKILRKLRGYGDDGSEPRPIKFHFVFPNRKAALEFSAVASEKGFEYEDLFQEPAPEGMVLPRYHLVLNRVLPFNLELLDLVDEYLLDLSAEYDATYRSLETDVV
ncbi:MAG: ribonuclease E inhibitor RraB, partial [Clostridia bacterium]|nr:ribonuclease E inhibitor RraB [Clostridia bacterium]